MKVTMFKFGIELTSEAAFDSIRKKLLQVKGVASVDLIEETLLVHASFEDAEAAKKTHRKIMIAMANADGVTVTHTTSRLTDIF